MGYLLPFDRSIDRSQDFGANPNNGINPIGGHNGDDWRTPTGTPVRAAGDGIIEFAGQFDDTYWDNFGWNLNMGGLMVVLNCDGPDGPYFEYGHLSLILVVPGQRVKRGDIIALTGNSDGGTGVSTGPHCHVGCLPPNFNINSSTYGRVNPRIYMTEHWDGETPSITYAGTVTPQGATTPNIEEDEDMQTVFRDTSSADPDKIYVGNALFHRHVTSLAELEHMQVMAREGKLKLFKDGEVQNQPLICFGFNLADLTGHAAVNAPFPYYEPRTGVPSGTTTIANALGASDLQFVATRDEVK